MAGEPAPLAAVQAAVLKSSASQAAQANKPALAATAVAQDLSVMADQAKSYSAGVAAGNVEADKQGGAIAARMAEDRAHADSIRAQELALERLQTQRAQADADGQRQSQANRLRDAQRERDFVDQPQTQAEVEKGWQDNANSVAFHARTHYGPRFNTALDSILSSGASTPAEAMALFDAWQSKQYADTDQGKSVHNIDRATIARYVRAVFDAGNGKSVDTSTLAPKRK